MSIWALAVLLGVALPLLVLNLVLAVEVFAGLFAPTPAPVDTRIVDCVVVMPAHDEEGVIGTTLAALITQLPEGFRVLVVADNCTDATADVARRHGAWVLERTEVNRRGKGFALAFARDALRPTPPEVVVVLDADCMVDRRSLSTIASTARRTNAPVQAIDLLVPDLSAAPFVQFSNFAFAVKNQVRQQGLARLARSSLIAGTGFAMPWSLFNETIEATDSQVEDLVLGLDLLGKGIRTGLRSDAYVWSAASGEKNTLEQRARWEGGFLATAAQRGLPLLLRAVCCLDARLLWSGLSLLVPPLALLVALNSVALGLTAIVAYFGEPAPFGLLMATFAVACLAIVIAWLVVGRRFLTARAALALPLYIIAKLPLYLGVLRGRRAGWLRSRR